MSDLPEQAPAAPFDVTSFDDLLPKVAELAERGDKSGLDRMTASFDALVARLELAVDGWRGAEIIPFVVRPNGRVARMTAAAADGLILSPGDDLMALLNTAGRTTFETVVADGGPERLISARILPEERTALVGIKRTETGVLARALITFWRPEIGEALRRDFLLSETETEVARALFEGLRAKVIAEIRGRSTETIRSQVKAIFQKTNVSNVLELAHIIYGLNAHPSVGAPVSAVVRSGEARVWHGSQWPVDVFCDGSPDGKPLLFMHGCLGGCRFVARARDRLASRFVIAPGRPNHGRTPETGSNWRRGPEVAAQQALSVLDSAGVRKTDLISYDIGAAGALTLAAMAPERIERVLIISCLPPMPNLSDLMAIPQQQRVFPVLSRISMRAGKALARLGGERLLEGGPEAFGSIVFAGSQADTAACKDPRVSEQFWRGHGWHTIQGPDGFFFDAALAGTAWHETLCDLSVPVTFLHGEDDASAPLSKVNSLASHVGGTVVPVPRIGHTLVHSRPELWLDLLENEAF
ncbi:alpha/beta fold hydrolase [uncultured Roseobacter sp.]|uniref:alpha/beta fold hydrolase n=1 Tax=uncultured Roseobacter sp. TaxID=114847 RepID=UPI00261BB8AF|nr:alpha/beta fold hydrolase [uncultured Roseobacter sp.]